MKSRGIIHEGKGGYISETEMPERHPSIELLHWTIRHCIARNCWRWRCHAN